MRYGKSSQTNKKQREQNKAPKEDQTTRVHIHVCMSAYALSILRSLVFSFCAYTSQGEKYTNEKRDNIYNTHTDAFPHVFGTCACMYVITYTYSPLAVYSHECAE